MNAVKVTVALVAVVAAIGAWKSGAFDRVSDQVSAAAQQTGSTGFVSIPMPDGMAAQGVVIFAPENCPSDAAQRASALASFLSERRIGHVQSTSANYENLASQDEVSRVMSVMNGQIPIVYVNGKAKANPTPEEVEAEFRRTGPG